MIAFARAVARRFRTVVKRCASGRTRGLSPPLRITAGAGTITLAAHLGEVVITLTVPADQTGQESLTLPLSVLEACEGSTPDPIMLEVNGKSKGTARWQDRGLPRSVEFEQVEHTLSWPDESVSLAPVWTELLPALHEAGRTAAREPGKYAMHRIQIRGKQGEVNGTDGKQCLIQGGFEFPFPHDLNLPAIPVFGCKDFADETDIRVGLAGDWFGVAIGPWRVWLLIDKEVRFPDVAGVIPRATGTRFTLSDADAELLLGDLQAWPREFESPGSVTLDLGVRVSARAKISQSGDVVERVLRESNSVGPPVLVVLGRDYLARALSLGFRQFQCASPERPLVARDQHRVYLAVTQVPADALPATKANIQAPEPVAAKVTVRVPKETSVPVVASAPQAPSPDPNQLTPSRRSVMPVREHSPAERNGHTEPSPDSLDLFVEAEAIRTLFTEAATRMGRLIGALKHYKRERRSLQAAWSSLRDLKLG